MLATLIRMDKMAAIHRKFTKLGMLAGSTSSFMARAKATETCSADVKVEDECCDDGDDDDDDDDEEEPVSGSADNSLSDVALAARPRMCSISFSFLLFKTFTELHYPQHIYQLAEFIHQPAFPFALRRFLFILNNPNKPIPTAIEDLPAFEGKIKVYHSATATFYAPSDLCGAGGLRRELIRSTPSFHGHEQRDTVFVVPDDFQKGMEGMEIGRILLFFSFSYRRQTYSCALINWYVHNDEPDHDTGMWPVQLEQDAQGHPTVDVIDIDTIA